MNKKHEKTRSSVAAPERETGSKQSPDSHTSSTDFITQKDIQQEISVMRVLRTGIENAITAKEIAQLLHISDTRMITKQIERERRRGAPICAAVHGEHKGYYLADDPQSLADYLRVLDHRAREIQRTAEKMRTCSEQERKSSSTGE